MPIGLDLFLQQAGAIADTQQFHVVDDHMEQGTGLHGLKKLSSSAHAAENRATVQAFIHALEQDPRYAATLAQTRAPLDALMNEGKPLTAGVVKQAMLELEVTRGMALGRELARDGRIPAGHGSSFGQYAAMRGLPLDTPADQAGAVREYLLHEVYPRNMGVMAAIQDMGDKSNAAGRLLAACGRSRSVEESWCAQMLDRELAGGVGNFSFDTFAATAYSRFHEGKLNVMRQLGKDTLEQLGGMPGGPELLTCLEEAMPSLGDGDAEKLLQHLVATDARLNTPASRMEAVREFMLNNLGSEAGRDIMAAHGLPESFATAVGHNPKVAAEAKAGLNKALAPGELPTREKVLDALRAAAENFTSAHEAELRELAIMAQDPPVTLTPPLTLETMPRYLNAMLAGDVLLEPLLHDNAPIDAAFLQALSDHAEALNSAAHSIRGDFGSDDMNTVLENSIRLLLARRGVPQEMLPELVTRALSRFGRLSCELTSVNNAVQDGLGGAAGIAFLRKGMTLYRTLENHAYTLLYLLSDEQRRNMQLEAFSRSDADSEAVKREKREQCGALMEQTFQSEGRLDELSPLVRDFARAQGVPVPDMSAAAAAKSGQRAAAQLSRDNLSMANAVLDSFVPSTGDMIVSPTQEFRAFFAEAALGNDFSGIDLERLNLVPFNVAATTAARSAARQASLAGRPVQPGEIRRAIDQSLVQGLKELKTTLDAVNAFPEKTVQGKKAVGFTAEEKVVLRNVVQRFGVRDPEIIRRIAEAARDGNFVTALRQMTYPDPTAAQIAASARAVTSAYMDFRNTLPQHFVGVEDVLPMMLALGMETGGITAQEKEYLAGALDSELARRVGASYAYAMIQSGVSERGRGECLSILSVMSQLHMEALIATRGNATYAPVRFSDPLGHISEAPSGMDGVVGELRKVVGRGIPPMAVTFSKRQPPFTRQQWDTLSQVHEELSKQLESFPRKSILADILTSSADDILAAVASNGGKAPSMEQFWDIFTGGALGAIPGDIAGENGLARMLQHLDRTYQQRMHAADPNISQDVLQESFTINVGMGVNIRKLFELTQPGASLSIEDISLPLKMSSLRGIDEGSGYGLVVDFRRQSPDAELRFTRADGTALVEHPRPIPIEESNKDHSAIKGMVDFMRGMTHSDAQLRRVAQAFTQASLIMPRYYSALFPGTLYSEHGRFQMHATENTDGSVTMDIRSDPAHPLQLRQQFRIMPDGSHTCTAFELRRPAVGE